MVMKLASDSLSDAQVTDGIGRGDLGSAARLWVRSWPTALTAARRYVDPPEVPGLAAEALIGTISMTALGRGPREDVSAFIIAAVHELGEDDELLGNEPEPAPAPAPANLPEVYASPQLSRSFAELPIGAQSSLRAVAHGEDPNEASDYALTVLQTSYLTSHLDQAPARECRPTHIALMAAAEGQPLGGFAATNWVHMSTCAWCTEAFHELAFSNVALDALIAPAVLAGVALAPAPQPEVAELVEEPVAELVEEPVEEPVIAAVADNVVTDEPTSTEPTTTEPTTDEEPPAAHRAGVHAVLRGSRSRILTAAALTAAVALIAVVISQNTSGEDDPATTSAPTSALPTPGGFVTGGNDAFELDALPDSPTASPTAEVDVPSSIPVPSGLPDATLTPSADPTPSATATASPTKKPTKTPSVPATSAPSTPAPSTAPPTPSATPTRSCNGLQQLLGICRGR